MNVLTLTSLKRCGTECAGLMTVLYKYTEEKMFGSAVSQTINYLQGF